MKIVHDKRIDRLDFAVADEMIVAIEVSYSNALTSLVTIDLASIDSVVSEAFMKINDYTTFLVEEGASICKVTRNGKIFSLSGSYVRNKEATESVTSLSTGFPLIVRFELASFTANKVIDLNLWYDSDFLPGELEHLSANGIEVSGTGIEFEITNTIDCKVSFVKPEGVTDIYVIVDDNYNEIITV
jgi:hypothetical protein